MVVTGPLKRHLAGALRLRVDETVILVDGPERLECRVVSVGKAEMVTRVRAVSPLPDPGWRLTLAVGMPKGKKLEEIVKRAVELGVHRVQPILTERSVPRGKEGRDRGERLAAIALEAAQQSGRASVPEVMAPMPFERFVDAPLAGLGVVLWEQETAAPLLTVLKGGHLNCNEQLVQVTLLVGPEGGLSVAEVDRLTAAGYVRAGMGATILRTETACIAGLAVLGAALEAETGDTAS